MTAAHEPTKETRAQVSSLVSFGVTQPEICKFLGIDQKTLHKYYRYEIDTAAIRANAAVARVLYEKAVIKKESAAVFFWLKTRARWRERGEDGESPANDLLTMLLNGKVKLVEND